MLAAVEQLLATEFEVVAAVEDGESMLEVVVRLRPDVIVVDVDMPGISGLDVVRQLVADACTATMVVLSVHEEEELAEEARRAGAAAYVVKSRMVRDLPAAIRSGAANEPFVARL